MWMITRDFVTRGVNEVLSGDKLPSRVGTGVYPHSDPQELKLSAQTLKTRGKRFRLLDDDRIVYYHGTAMSDDAIEEAFYWGEHDAGVAIAQVKSKTGEWEDFIS